MSLGAGTAGQNFKEYVVRHKYRLADFGLVLAATSLMTFAGLSVDIFANTGKHTPKATTLELDELLAVVAVFFLGLLWAVRRLIRERRQAAERLSHEREIRALALNDALTGLPNRRYFEDALNKAVMSPARAGASHAVLLLDLNGFKLVNDIYGHAAGDELLIHVAGRLSRAARQGDVVARLGGDEFGILATHLPSSEAATGIALRVLESLASPVITAFGEHVVGTAIGIALTPEDASVPSELLRKADIALYRVKEDKISGLRFFEAEMDAKVREREQLERELRVAIQEGTITTVYQPLIDLKTGAVRAFEALARWHHPLLGKIPPARFIAIAEDANLIAPLTDMLLVQACESAREWDGAVELSFNVSPLLLQDPGLPDRVFRTLASSGFPACRLELEITESALVKNLEAAQQVLGKIRAAGVKVALDDFGTGYSNLYHLRSLKVDKIKIDRSFIAGMVGDQEADQVVRAFVGLGSGLGLQVLAEGVETEEQSRMLVEHGCDQAQGFYFSEPVTASAALALSNSQVLAQLSA